MSAQPNKVNQDSIAHAFVARSQAISPAVLRLGGGNSSALTIRELEAAISLDPAFSLRALALANSAFYSQQHEISTLRDALVVLGAEVVHNLAASLLARALHDSPKTVDEVLWEHCHAVGLASQMLAETHRRVSPRSAFAAGLLHDIGILALQSLDHDDPESYARHEEIGGQIALLLGIAPSLSSAIRSHGGGASAEPDNAPLEATVFVANELALRCGYSHDRESAADDRRLRANISFLGLEEADFDALGAALPARLQALEASTP
ncbi:MAG: HDOD domain-containing protein [Gammaproteobacteria bacterium]